MPLNARNEENIESSAPEECAGIYGTNSGHPDPNNLIQASEPGPSPQTALESADTPEEPVAGSTNTTSSPLLEGWRLYTVQVA